VGAQDGLDGGVLEVDGRVQGSAANLVDLLFSWGC
jgi:hypothetical protein